MPRTAGDELVEEQDDGLWADEVDADTVREGAVDEADAQDLTPPGPFDVGDVIDDGLPRVDLGAIQVPVIPGSEVRVDVQNDQVVAANIVVGDSALQLQVFAAPRSSGIWEEVRAELVGGIGQSGGTADEQLGTFGVELRANVPVRRQDGSSALQPARFVGHDGPRWFLRGVITGSAVSDPERAAFLEQAFRAVVVVRGDDPRPPREPLDLRLPEAAAQAEAVDEDGEDGEDGDTLEPFTRGPEITETR